MPEPPNSQRRHERRGPVDPMSPHAHNPDPAAGADDAGADPRHDVDIAAVRAIADRLAVDVNDPAKLVESLTHRSYAFEQGVRPHNERMEFLGDAVLGLIVTDQIFHHEPDSTEGRLAKLRSVVVSESSLAGVARGLGLGAHVRLGRGEDASGGRDKDSILADTLEAVIGAIYLDQGLVVVERLVRSWFAEPIADLAARPEAVDAKTALQELLAGAGRPLPVYEISEAGPDHAKRFAAVVRVEQTPLGQGEGRTKKEAEQGAAAEAVQWLRDSPEGEAVSSGGSTAAGGNAREGGRR